VTPLVKYLIPKNIDFLTVESVWAMDIFIVCGILGNESAFLEEIYMLGKTLLVCEYLDISE
jgi:hypothetical protein